MTATIPISKIWKTIQLGTGLNTDDDFRKAFQKADCNIGDQADKILGKPAFTVSLKAKEVELVIASVADLGFESGANRKDIYNRTNDLGLDLCLSEVGPQLRLQYKDQPRGEWLLIGMRPISDSFYGFSIFSVERGGDDRCWLHAYLSPPNLVYNASSRWVFLRRKQFRSS